MRLLAYGLAVGAEDAQAHVRAADITGNGPYDHEPEHPFLASRLDPTPRRQRKERRAEGNAKKYRQDDQKISHRGKYA